MNGSPPPPPPPPSSANRNPGFQGEPAKPSSPDRSTTSQSHHSPGKRKSSEAPNDPHHHSAGGDDGANSKGKKRRKVTNACVYCRRSHMTCDLERPCARCVKRDIGHLCHDEPREGPKRSKSEVGVGGVQEIAPAPEEGKGELGLDGINGGGGPVYAGMNGVGGMGGLNVDVDPSATAGGQQQMVQQPAPISPVQLQHAQIAPNAAGTAGTGAMAPQSFDWNNNGLQNQFQDMHHLHPNYMFNTSEVTNEYNLLNDFLSSSLLDDGGLYTSDDAQSLFNDPLLATSSINALANNYQPQLQQHQLSNQPQPHPQQQQQQQQRQPPTLQPAPHNARAAGEEISRPPSSAAFPISDKARDKFYMTAADPAGLSSAGDRLHKLLRAKYDAGMLKPFNYVKGYARLQSYMSRHLHASSQRRILEQLGKFRPKFREAMHSLTDMQLVLVEMWFERSLMEYDRVFASMAIPACCWRRTGEIFRGNREMAELIGVPMERLRDGKLAIHEIIAEDSLVSYWEKFGAIAFDQSQKAILTSCSLKSPAKEGSGGEAPSRDGGKSGGDGSGAVSSEGKEGQAGREGQAGKGGEQRVKCCFSFTIRRDTHNIPSLIVGNFLPIRPRGQQ